jgi:hypothetical protein
MEAQTKNMQIKTPVDLHTWLRMEAFRRGTTLQELALKALNDLRHNIEKESK